jgi:hypothetical protein
MNGKIWLPSIIRPPANKGQEDSARIGEFGRDSAAGTSARSKGLLGTWVAKGIEMTNV